MITATKPGTLPCLQLSLSSYCVHIRKNTFHQPTPQSNHWPIPSVTTHCYFKKFCDSSIVFSSLKFGEWLSLSYIKLHVPEVLNVIKNIIKIVILTQYQTVFPNLIANKNICILMYKWGSLMTNQSRKINFIWLTAYLTSTIIKTISDISKTLHNCLHVSKFNSK